MPSYISQANRDSISRTRARKKARSDVNRVSTFAEYVIYINEVGTPLRILHNEQFQMKQIAVVGPGKIQGADDEYCDSVLLYEIGRHRAYAYQRSRGYAQSDAKVRNVLKRLPQRALAETQIRNSLRAVWDVLIHDMTLVMKSRKLTHWTISSIGKGQVSRQTGVRYSVPFENTEVCWAIAKSECRRRQAPVIGDIVRTARSIMVPDLKQYRSVYLSKERFYKEIDTPGTSLYKLYHWHEARSLGPHLLYLMRKEFFSARAYEEWGIFLRVLQEISPNTHDEDVLRWGSGCEDETILAAPDDVYVWTVPRSFADGANRLSFEVIPRTESVESRIDPYDMGFREYVYNTHDIPF